MKPTGTAQATHFIVIPCYNEESRLKLASFEKDLKHYPDIHLVFVDDGSRDQTASVLNAFREAHAGRVTVYPMPENRGKAEAVRQGILHVHARLIGARYKQTVGFLDADLATSLEEYMRLTRAIIHNNYAVVIGSRVPRLGARIRRKRSRMLLGRAFATAVSLILDISVFDTQCGAKCFHPDMIGPLFEVGFKQKWLFDVEILRRARNTCTKERMLEIPLWSWEDVKGSKLRLRDFIGAFRELFHVWVDNRKHPPSDRTLPSNVTTPDDEDFAA